MQNKKQYLYQKIFRFFLNLLTQEPSNREGLIEILRNAENRNLLDADALLMIEGALHVSETHVRDIMVPRVQMIIIDNNAKPEEILKSVVESGHSRFPVIGDSNDEIEGILLAKDLLNYYADPNKNFDIKDVMRPTVFIPESKRLNVLLREFRMSRNHMAIVVDEYNGVAGLVTIEDVIEEIIGEIQDEYDMTDIPLINQTAANKYEIDAAISHYDFASLHSDSFGRYSVENMNALLKDSTWATKAIIKQVIDYSENRHGVMIFAATVMHAKEIVGYLPAEQTALITGETDNNERDQIITLFKQKQLKFLVNVSVLTTGFDAPHVDYIAILRPTESVSLYQQIVGRGLRLSEGKKDCLVIDYAGNGFDLFYPEVGSKKGQSDNEPVQVLCPGSGFANIFWGKTDDSGKVIEHFGRRCQGLLDDGDTQEQCDYRFRFKECEQCGEQNDIAARQCQSCGAMMADPDDKLREALNLKDALVLRCSGLSAKALPNGLLKISYFDEDGASCDEIFNLANDTGRFIFNKQFQRQ